MNVLREWRKERDVQELKALDSKMEQIEDKISKSSRLHENHINRVASEAKLRNSKLLDKMIYA
jgi:CRISPR/Cas system CSM-associated protein Csm3 (group 7 of RAMP superfamily)